MSLFSRLISQPKAPLFFAAALALASGPIQPGPVAAQEVIIAPGPLVRKFPQDFFCPFPIELQFTATASTAKIHAVANIYVNSGGSFLYTHQAIDNIFLVTAADYTAHAVANDEFGDYGPCYLDAMVPTIFQFDQLTPGAAKLSEQFATDAALWDLTQGAYYDPLRSGDNDPSHDSPPPHDRTGGCLGLGLENATPSVQDSARTSIMVSGLTPGQPYNLTGWWTVGDGIFTDQASLTIKVTGPGSTPLVQRTWGALKGRYR